MATYAIGDIQGCYQPLMQLLDRINYDDRRDALWFCGDLINRGHDSLRTLRFLKQLKQCQIVLGNHDLHLLAVANSAVETTSHDTFQDVLSAQDCSVLCRWLVQQPLLHYDSELKFAMVHAGFIPNWDLDEALMLASEAQEQLRSQTDSTSFYRTLYLPSEIAWQDVEQTDQRIPFIINTLTKIRFCSQEGRHNFLLKGEAHRNDSVYRPWFYWPHRATKNVNLVFGHWSALRGHCPVPNTFAIDTGCVWGEELTALRLEDQRRFKVTNS